MVYERIGPKRIHRDVYTSIQRSCRCPEKHTDRQSPTLTLVLVWLPTTLLRTCTVIRDEASDILQKAVSEYQEREELTRSKLIVHIHERRPCEPWERSTDLAEVLALVGMSLKTAETRAPLPKTPTKSHVLPDGAQLVWTQERLQWVRQAKQQLLRAHNANRERRQVQIAFRATVARRKQMESGSWSLKPYCLQSSIRTLYARGIVDIDITALPTKLEFRAARAANIVEQTGLRINVLPENTLQEWDWVANWAERDLVW